MLVCYTEHRELHRREYRAEGKNKIRFHWKVGKNTRTDQCSRFSGNRAALYQHCCLISYSF